MLKRLDRNIKVLVCQGTEQNHSVNYIVRYNCAKCKHVFECPDPSKCCFVDYIRARLPNVSYVCSTGVPVVRIYVSNAEAQKRAISIINRAQRLRSNRAIVNQKIL